VNLRRSYDELRKNLRSFENQAPGATLLNANPTPTPTITLTVTLSQSLTKNHTPCRKSHPRHNKITHAVIYTHTQGKQNVTCHVTLLCTSHAPPQHQHGQLTHRPVYSTDYQRSSAVVDKPPDACAVKRIFRHFYHFPI